MASSVDANKELVRRHFDNINRGNIEAFDDYCVDDYVWRGIDPEGLGEAIGRAAFKEALAGFGKTLPDINFEILEILAEGDKVACHCLASGHHTGAPWLGAEPAGAFVEWHTYVIYSVRDGKLASENFLDDNCTIMKALGIKEILPATA